jgi:hypothetical protein
MEFGFAEPRSVPPLLKEPTKASWLRSEATLWECGGRAAERSAAGRRHALDEWSVRTTREHMSRHQPMNTLLLSRSTHPKAPSPLALSAHSIKLHSCIRL